MNEILSNISCWDRLLDMLGHCQILTTIFVRLAMTLHPFNDSVA